MRKATAQTTVTVMHGRSGSVASLPPLILSLKSPGAAPREMPLGLRSVVIGSSADCDLICEDSRVSRRHCEVGSSEQGVVLRDLDSKNGTQVAGISIREVYLEVGVEVALGDSTLTLIEKGPAQSVPLHGASAFGEARGGSVVMRALFARLAQAASEDVSIVLWGESGSGKDVLAEAIHAHSRRASKPFIVFDCGAVASGLVAEELFGHDAGAFTGAQKPRAGLFEEAHEGTLVLNEVGQLPLEHQPLLLRALESGETRRLGGQTTHKSNVRIIATSQRDLRAQMASGQFRQDLFFRLAGIEAWIPPLRERKDDLPMLVEHFLTQMEPPHTLADLPARTLELFASYHWPGNVRELGNLVHRTLLFPELEQTPAGLVRPRASKDVMPYRLAREASLAAFERQYVKEQLDAHEGNVAAAAQAMGVSRQFLYRLITRHGLGQRGSL